jgi:ferredoxin
MQSHSDRNATVRQKKRASHYIHASSTSLIRLPSGDISKSVCLQIPACASVRPVNAATPKQKWKASRENVSKDSFATEQSAMRQFAKGTRMRHDACARPRAQGYQRHADKLDLCSVREP